MARCPYCGQKDCCGTDLDLELTVEREKVRVMRETLEDIVAYWNRDRNDQAMADALAVIITTADEALATTEDV